MANRVNANIWALNGKKWIPYPEYKRGEAEGIYPDKSNAKDYIPLRKRRELGQWNGEERKNP